MPELLICFYGDDFTGATDALECLAQAGARTVLFIEPPTAAQLARYPGLQAIGVAGMTRSMTADAMEVTLRPALTTLRQLGAPHVHYKICSTFDSSPTIGSIGRVIDMAFETFGATFVPLLVAAPALGRHCVFGNLFARFGSDGSLYRLDRHPSMSQHPITPADESDLRLHLARQTRKRIALFDILKVQLPWKEARAALDALLKEGPEVVLFDALYEAQLPRIGQLIDPFASHARPLFSVGSSGLDMGLCAHWAAQGQLVPVAHWPEPGLVEPLLVASGSCSPVTEGQIAWALANGFAEVALDTVELAESKDAPQIEQRAAEQAVRDLNTGRSVIVHTSPGNKDPRIVAATHPSGRPESSLRQVQPFVAPATKGCSGDAPLSGSDWLRPPLQDTGLEPARPAEGRAAVGRRLGEALGRIVREALTQVRVRRLCIAGGDTSGHVAKALGVESLKMIAPIVPGAPLCRAQAPGSVADGLEMNFKGGQVGAEDYFGTVARGR